MDSPDDFIDWVKQNEEDSCKRFICVNAKDPQYGIIVRIEKAEHQDSVEITRKICVLSGSGDVKNFDKEDVTIIKRFEDVPPTVLEAYTRFIYRFHAWLDGELSYRSLSFEIGDIICWGIDNGQSQ